jgi:hypothetical protein
MKKYLYIAIFLLFNFFFISIVSSGSPIPLTDDQVAYYDNLVVSENNPPLFDSCGLDVILVMDVSESIDNNEFSEMVSAFYDIVDSLLNETLSKISVIMFADNALIKIENSDDLIAIKNAISSRTNLGVQTNFKDALIKVQDIPDLRENVTNVVIFSSDGSVNLPSPSRRFFRFSYYRS